MSKEALKTAYIDFQAKGVQEIQTLITHLGRDLDKFSASLGQSQLKIANKLGDLSNKIKESAKKANEAVLVGTKASTAALGKEISALKLINKEFRGLASTSKELKGLGGRVSVRITQKSPELLRVEAAEKAAKIEEKAAKEAAREKLRAAKEAAREEKAAAREAEKRRRDFSNRIESAIKFVSKLGFGAYADYSKRMGIRTENLRYENLLRLSGIENARAINYGARMVSLGGTTEGALGTLNALSASLGGITRGDTSLLETLGKYGISGISGRTSPEELINKIRDRIQRGDLGKNEINSLLSQLPLDDAQKRAIMSSRADLFSGELEAFSVDERNIQALENNAIATEALRDANNEMSTHFTSIDNSISDLIQKNADWIATINQNSNAIGALTGLLPQIVSNLTSSLSEILGGLGGSGLSAAAAGAGGLMGSLLTKAKTVVRGAWNALKWGSRVATIPAAVGATAIGGTAATTAEFVERMRKNPVQENWGTGVGDNLKIQRLANMLMHPASGEYNMSRIEEFNRKYGGQIPIWDRFYSKLHSENSNSTITNNYYINYNSPQQETSIPFYLAARNQNGRMWEEDSIYNFSY